MTTNKTSVQLTEKQIDHLESAIIFCLSCGIITFDDDDLLEMKELEDMFGKLRGSNDK